MRIDKLYTSIEIQGEQVEVGMLISDGPSIFLKLSEEYLDTYFPLSNNRARLSPFKLKHTSEIQSTGNMPFEGLFGLFADSLPDAWGKLLLDRHLMSQGLEQNVTPLTRLAYVGNRGMGAMSYEPELDSFNRENFDINLYQFYKASEKIISGENSSILSNFYRLSGVSGGARPKINIGFNEANNEMMPDSNHLPKGFDSWIIKFPSRYDNVEIAKIEYAYYLLARETGIEVASSKLLNGENNTSFFATKRFDRISNQKLHFHSLSGLLHDDFTKSNLDYGHLMDAAYTLTGNRSAYQTVFRLMVFNIIFCNQDDHSKNFGFLMDRQRKWKFAPAYDLTFSPSPYNYHTISVAGTYQNISMRDVMKLANHFSIPDAKEIIDQVFEASRKWREIAVSLEIDKNNIQAIEKRIRLFK